MIPTLSHEFNVVIGGLNAPPAPFVPEEFHFRPEYVMVVTGFGSQEGHAEVLDRMRSALPPLFEFSTPMPYVALQQLLDEAQRWGQHVYEKSSYLEDRGDRRPHRTRAGQDATHVREPVLPPGRGVLGRGRRRDCLRGGHTPR